MLYKFIDEYFWMNILTDFLTDFLRVPLMDFLTGFLTDFLTEISTEFFDGDRVLDEFLDKVFNKFFDNFFIFQPSWALGLKYLWSCCLPAMVFWFQNRFLWEKVALLVEKNFPHTFYQNTSFNHFILKKTFLESYFPNIEWKKAS